MKSLAVVFQAPEQLALKEINLSEISPGQVLVETQFSGISTGTEKLLWFGKMPMFPGMGYPLVPGYECVGKVLSSNSGSAFEAGDWVFVPGARCFGEIRGLFGASASHLQVEGDRIFKINHLLGKVSFPQDLCLLALAATAQHALASIFASPINLPKEVKQSTLIVGHGTVGRLMARLLLAQGHTAPTVWETQANRMSGATGYLVVAPSQAPETRYNTIIDASGDSSILNSLIAKLAPGGEIILAGFYPGNINFDFAPAFMKEARLRIAAEWQRVDMLKVIDLIANGDLHLDGLVTHVEPVKDDASLSKAYLTAFTDPACLKLLFDWRRRAD